MKSIVKILVFSIALILSSGAFGQENLKSTIKGRLANNDGSPVIGATISAEGVRSVLSDADGNFTIEVSTETALLINAEGYKSLLIKKPEEMVSNSILMVKLPFKMTESDMVNMPFGTLPSRMISSAVSTLDPKEILSYDARQDVLEAIRGRIPGVFNSRNINGIGDATVVIDGIPTTELGSLNLNEVEQITVLRDAASRMLYGVQADKGVILITTKNGQPYKKEMRINFESGINKAISFPEYMSAADYMNFYNEALGNDTLYGLISSDAYKENYFRQDIIDSTRAGSDRIKYPDEDYYNSTYLKNFTNQFSLFGEVSGGNENVNYYSNFGWRRSNSLLKIGNAANEGRDVLNIRGKVNYQVNDFIRMNMSAWIVYDLNNSPNYTGPDFWDIAASYHPNYFPMLIPTSMFSDSTLLGAATLIDGNMVLGGTNQFRSNVYGDQVLGGVISNINRGLQIRPGLDFDLSGITEGLSANVTMAVDMNNNIQTFQDNSYAIYERSYETDTSGVESMVISKYGIDEKEDNRSIGSDISMYNRYTYSAVLNYDRVFNDHKVNTMALGYYDVYTLTGSYYPQKHLHFAGRANYMYKNKYVAEFTGVYAGSSRFGPQVKYGFSPGITLGWIMTEEGFLSGSTFLNYLKVRGSYGVIDTDQMISQYYLYNSIASASTTFVYGNGKSANRSLRFSGLGNSNLMFPKRKELSVGFDAVIAKKLSLETNYFVSQSLDNIVEREEYYPQIMGGIYRYENYNSFQTSGLDLGLKFKDKIGDLGYNIGVTYMAVSEKVLQKDELANIEEYLSQVGQPMDARFGLVYDRFYTEADFGVDGNLNPGEPIPAFGKVSPGDLRYLDLNNDMVIDANDKKIIGGSLPDHQLSLEFRLQYKSFELFALGTAQFGASNYTSGNYYWVDGNDKYSNVISGRWTPGSGQNASYPRLTSQSSSNNFRNSTFWLYSQNAFNLHALQLSYNFQTQKISWMQSAQVYVRGFNLLTISKESEKLLLDVGKSPKMRGIFTIGLNASF